MARLCALLFASAALFANAGEADEVSRLPQQRRDQSHLSPRRKMAEQNATEGGEVSPFEDCPEGFQAQYQKTYCSTDLDADYQSLVRMGVFADSTCSGEPLVSTACECTAALASLDECTPGTTSMNGAMGKCDGDQLMDVYYATSDCSGEPAFNLTQTKCEKFCVPIEKQWGDNGTCLMFNGRAFEDGCRCDSTCGSCGYYQEDAMKSVMMMWPNAPWDCIACKDGLPKIVLFEDGMGVCVPPTETECFDAPGGTALPNCTCHATCASCGYSDNPTSPDNCIACRNGFIMQYLPDSDGSSSGAGRCVATGSPSGWVDTQPQDEEEFDSSMSMSAAEIGVGAGITLCMVGLAVSLGMYARSSVSAARGHRAEGAPLCTQLASRGIGYGAQELSINLEETQSLLGASRRDLPVA